MITLENSRRERYCCILNIAGGRRTLIYYGSIGIDDLPKEVSTRPSDIGVDDVLHINIYYFVGEGR
jgi:hypothetical protein